MSKGGSNTIISIEIQNIEYVVFNSMEISKNNYNVEFKNKKIDFIIDEKYNYFKNKRNFTQEIYL